MYYSFTANLSNAEVLLQLPSGVQPGTERYSECQKFEKCGFSIKQNVSFLAMYLCLQKRSCTALWCSSNVYSVFQARNCTIRLRDQGFEMLNSFSDSVTHNLFTPVVICRQLQWASPWTFAYYQAAIRFIFLNTWTYFFSQCYSVLKMCEWVCTLCQYE